MPARSPAFSHGHHLLACCDPALQPEHPRSPGSIHNFKLTSFLPGPPTKIRETGRGTNFPEDLPLTTHGCEWCDNFSQTKALATCLLSSCPFLLSEVSNSFRPRLLDRAS